MSPTNRCQSCGGPLPTEGVLGGSCPRCMLELGYETASERADVIPGMDSVHGVTFTPRVIGRYKVLRVIGEGGMGVVYEAEQEQPRRTVALKIIKSGMAMPESLQRFEQESHALGRLQHPGIAQIYEAGTLDTGFGPQPYFAMELIRGMAPRDYAESRHLNTKQRVEIMVKICDAVQHAHQRGLIHRDLKPANILVDDTGQPKILDFGVVRVTDGDTRSTLQTGMGQLIGTLAYMSPEQALADPLELDTRTDVYALGVILYELLAGRLPYTISKRLHETIEAIRQAEPVRLSVLNRTWRGDVETIVSKALEKDRTRRYASATGMAADLRRYLNDEPIAARPPSMGYQLWKFTQRHKAFVVGVVASFLVIAAWGVTNDLQARRARTLFAALNAKQQQLIAATDRANTNKEIADLESQKLRLALNEIIAAQTQTKQEIAKNKSESLHRLWESLARASVHDSASRENDDRAALLAVQAMRINARAPNPAHILVEEALQQATRLDPWTHNLLDGFETVVNSVAYSSDGTHIAAAGADGLVRVWDLRTLGAPPVVLKGHQGPVLTVAFSPDGEHIASGGSIDNTIRIWNYRKPGTPPTQFQFSPTPPRALLPAGKISSVAFSAHGEYLAAAGTDTDPVLAATSYTVRVWDLQNRDKQPLLLHRAASTNGVPSGGPPTSSVTFSHNGLRLASGGTDNAVWIWDLTKPGSSPVALREPGVAPTAPLYSGYSVAFSPDDAFLAAATGDSLVRLWNLQKPDEPALRFQDAGSVRSVAFSPDGHHLASAGSGRAVRIWDMNKPGAVLIDLRAHQAQVNSVAFSHDGARIASGSTDKTLRVWDIRNNGVPPITFNPPAASPLRGASNLNTTGTPAPPATISPELVGQIRIALVPVSTYAAAFSAGPARLAAFAMAGTISVWDLSKPTASPLTLQIDARVNDNALAISPDGAYLAAGGSDRVVRIWDLRKPEALPLLLQGSFFSTFNSVVFSSDGLSLAVAGTIYERRAGSTINAAVWDLRNPGAPPVLLRGLAGNVYSAAFSFDGSRLAVGNGSPENSVQIWDLHHPEAAPVVLSGHQDSVTSLAFSRDGHLLAGGSADGTRVWDFRNSPDTHILIRGPEGAVKSLAFSPDGKLLAAASNGGMRLFDLLETRTSPILFDRTANLGVAFLSDGTLATSGINGSVRVWPVWSAAADYLCTRVPRNLSMSEWQIYVGDDIPYERTCPALPPGSGVPETRK